MIKSLFLSILISLSCYSYSEKTSNLSNLKNSEALAQLRLDQGSLLMLDQVLKENDIQKNALVTFECEKKNKSRACRLLKIDVSKQ